jgi:chemotaxis protein MotB
MDNYDLSGARANSVRRIMLQSGLTLKQVVGVEALAATQPRRQDDPNHFSNRRVTVLLPYELNAAEIKNLPADGFGADREAHFIMPSDQVRQVMKPPVDAMRD